MSEVEDRAETNRTRWLVEIESWDWSLGLRMATKQLPEEAKVNGELMYSRGVDIGARVVAPKAHHEKTIRVSLSPSPLRYSASSTSGRS